MEETKTVTQNQAATTGPELFFAVIGAAGSDLSTLVETLHERLRSFLYTPHTIRLSDALSKWFDVEAKQETTEENRIDYFMKLGNDLRYSFERGDAVALLGLEYVRVKRRENGNDADCPLPRFAYIFNSLKHPSEVETLRQLYGPNLFVVSLYSPYGKRQKTLSNNIAKSYGTRDKTQYYTTADSLMQKDAKEVGNLYGQNVRTTFPKADYFIDETKNIDEQIYRFLNIIFGHPYMTPTRDEYGMFHASAAALRSSDLSRQVGALLTTPEGQIVAAGCNDVPASGGGHVWADSPEKYTDNRDFMEKGYDTNTVMKYEILTELFRALEDNEWLALTSSSQGEQPKKLADDILTGKLDPSFKDLRIANILEFGRIIHAEMSAICDAAARGIPVRGSWLYTTTFPCHMCARHLIAAGVKRVIYIEPYPKSMTKELYDSETKIEDEAKDDNVVEFVPFIGVSPSRYMDFFNMPQRKNEKGYTVSWSAVTPPWPRGVPTYGRYPEVEQRYVDILIRQNNGEGT